MGRKFTKFWWRGNEEFFRKKYAPVTISSGLLSMRSIGESICAINEVNSNEDIKRALAIFCDKHGVYRAGLLEINCKGSEMNGKPIATYNLEEYTDVYFQRDELNYDVIASVVQERSVPTPFGLASQVNGCCPEEDDHYDLARTFNCSLGLAIPLHSHNGYAMLALKVEGYEKDFSQRMAELAIQGQVFGTFCMDALTRLRQSSGISHPAEALDARLTSREAECLRWAAAGKTAWEISGILAVSERTVVAHTENAKRKLGARTLPQAVATAISRRLISI